MRHSFTTVIHNILHEEFGNKANEVFSSPLIQYINYKTKSADKGSKSRSSFANLYAIYVIIEDYINGGYLQEGKYKDYEGAKFTDLFKRQRELPFGEKLQNHALNHRLNQEFIKYFPSIEMPIIIRDVESSRYWINENLIFTHVSNKKYNLAETILRIINAYIDVKRNSFTQFIKQCEQIKKLDEKSNEKVVEFIKNLLEPSVDARLFEIVSYSILKYYYGEQTVFFGFDEDNIQKEELKLFKMGRTNANDGGY